MRAMVACSPVRCAVALLLSSACGGDDDGSAAGSSDTSGGTSVGTTSTGATTTSTGALEGADTVDSSEADGSSTGVTMDPAPIELCASGLPFELVRDPEGEPIDPAVRTAMTQRYLDLLDAIRYFDF